MAEQSEMSGNFLEEGTIHDRLPFNLLLGRQIDRTLFSLGGDPYLFTTNVEGLSALLSPFFDKIIMEDFNEISAQMSKQRAGATDRNGVNENEVNKLRVQEAMIKFKALMILVRRKGLLPLETVTEEMNS